MLSIAIFANFEKPHIHQVLKRILKFFETKKVRLMLPEEEAHVFGIQEFSTADIEHQPTDIALSLGGDGTLLGVCRRYGELPVPVCGINLGTLGFMADIEPNELEIKLEKILSGDYRIEHRLLLAGFVNKATEEGFLGHAINDVVVTKGGMARMLHLGLAVNDTHLMDCQADGIIVSSPTGSTAYSLSAGGPIVNPSVNALLLTPICAHTFDLRPLVINKNDVVHIKIDAVHQDIAVTFDGQKSFGLLPGDEVIVKQSRVRTNIVKFDDKDYYQILRTKLWGYRDT